MILGYIIFIQKVLTLCAITSDPTWPGLWQQAKRNPPHPLSTTPPPNIQNRKNSHDPVPQYPWSPTSNFFFGGLCLCGLGGIGRNGNQNGDLCPLTVQNFSLFSFEPWLEPPHVGFGPPRALKSSSYTW